MFVSVARLLHCSGLSFDQNLVGHYGFSHQNNIPRDVVPKTISNSGPDLKNLFRGGEGCHCGFT